MKKKFKITASYVTYVVAEIEAKDRDEAFEIALEMDGGEFEQENDWCNDNWRIDDIEEIKE